LVDGYRIVKVSAVDGTRATSGLAEFADESPAGVKLYDSRISIIKDVDVSGACNGYRSGSRKLRSHIILLRREIERV
jgi:hypothetical protein